MRRALVIVAVLVSSCAHLRRQWLLDGYCAREVCHDIGSMDEDTSECVCGEEMKRIKIPAIPTTILPKNICAV